MTQKTLVIKLKGIDWITLFFCTWMLSLIAFGWDKVHNPLTHYINYLSIIASLLGLIWLTEYMKERLSPEICSKAVCRSFRLHVYRLLAFIRNYYPVLLYTYFFISVSATNKVFFSDWLDPFFMDIDLQIFGYLPSMVWGVKYDYPWLRELLYFSYFAYYPMIIGLPVLFYLKRRKSVEEVVFVLSFVFYVCYFIFSWLPVIGGRFIPEAMEWSKQSRGGVFPAVMAYIYTKSQHLGGAFPSSHVAIAVVLSLLAYKYFRIVGIVFLVVTFFLSISTVYCHYHWFIDPVFGVITGLLGYWLAQKIYMRLSEKMP